MPGDQIDGNDVSSLRLTVAELLAEFATATDGASIPEEIRARARVHLLDTVGCGLAATATGAGDPAALVALSAGGRAEASLIGEPALAPAALAALANGTRCHALDFDDTHEAGICHASTVVLPAALALGEATDSTGAEVLSAYVLGAEVALRISIAVADDLYARGFHPTPICGAFGAAAASSRLLRLEPREATRALGIVGSFAAGLFEYLADGSDTKPLHAGWAAQAGIQAARLAAAGATGPASVIEGRFGLIASHGGSSPRAGAITEGLGESWEFAELAIKPFPACHFAHASTWAAAGLVAEHGLATAEIDEVVVRVPAEGASLVLEPLAAKLAPRTVYDAKFSLPFALAHRIVKGHLDLGAFTPAAIIDADVLDLAGRVRAEPLSTGAAPSRFAGGARLLTRDGRQFDRFIAHAPGTPRNPLDEASVLAKFEDNAGLALASPAVADLADALRGVDEAPSLREAMALLRASEPDRTGAA